MQGDLKEEREMHGDLSEDHEMQGDRHEELGLAPGAAAAPKPARVRGHGGKPFSAAEEDELRRGNLKSRYPNPSPIPNPHPKSLSLSLTLRRAPARQRRVGHHPSHGQLRGASHQRRPEGQVAQHGSCRRAEVGPHGLGLGVGVGVGVGVGLGLGLGLAQPYP